MPPVRLTALLILILSAFTAVESPGPPPEIPRPAQDARFHTQGDIQTQIRVTERQSEIDRWTRILTAEEPTFNTRQNAFLVELVKGRSMGPGVVFDAGEIPDLFPGLR